MEDIERAKKYATYYKGDLEKCDSLQVKEEVREASWNKQLPFPLPDKVFVHPDQSEISSGYLRIILPNKVVAVFREAHFKGTDKVS